MSLRQTLFLTGAILLPRFVAAAEPIQLTVGGKLPFYAFVADQDEKAGERLSATGLLADGEVYFKGKTKLENETEITAVIELEAEARNDVNADEAYVTFKGDYGQFRIGEKEGFNSDFIDKPIPEAFLTTDQEIVGDVLTRRNSLKLKDAFTFKRFSNDRLTLAYATPEWNGLKAAVSYTPNTSTDEGVFDRNSVANNGIDVSGGYTAKFNDLSLSLGAGYFHAAASVAGNDGVSAWNSSASVHWGQFKVGGSYAGVRPTNGQREHEWVLGVQYDLGKTQISADVLHAAKNVSAIVRDETVDRYKIDVAYELTKGVKVGLAGFVAQQRDNKGVSYDGLGVISGIALKF